MVLRFGHDYDETCMQMDEARGRCALLSPNAHAAHASPPPQTLAGIGEKVKNFAVCYVVDITEARALC